MMTGTVSPSILKGYRTIIFSTLTSVCGVLALIDWGTVVPVQVAGIIVAGIGLANAVLRYFTNTPIGSPVPTDVPPGVAKVLKDAEPLMPEHVVAALNRATDNAKL